MTKAYAMNGYIEKARNAIPRSRFRYMALNDIMNDVKQDPGNFTGDESLETKVLNKVLSLIEDTISEVKNQAVKCLGSLIKVVRENQMETIMDKLIDLSGRNDEEIRDIAGLALKTITAELPQDSKLASKTCNKLTPKLLNQLKDSSTAPASIIDILAILSTLVTRFPAYMSNPAIKPQPLSVLTPLLNHPRPAVQKRAIVTLAQFLPPSPDDAFETLLKDSLLPNLTASSTAVQRTNVQLIAAVARYTPQKIAVALPNLIPGILKAASKDDPELREGALQALETLVLRCPTEISQYLNSIISVGTQLIKYDPNFAGEDEDDEDEEMADADEESDGAGLDEYSDDEDTSYKIRRSATKLLAAIISTRPELLQTLYRDVSPVLISRFGDREVSVKLEIWATYTLLLNQTLVYGGVIKAREAEAVSPLKRKRDSPDGMDLDGSPLFLLKGQVAALSKQLLNQLKGPKVPPAVFQSGFTLLIALLDVFPGVLSAQTVQVMGISKTVLSGQVSTTTASFHVTALSFLGLFFSTHPPVAYSASLTTITPAIVLSAKQKHPRVSSEAFKVFSALLKSLKPAKTGSWGEEVYAEALSRLTTSDTDLQVRQSAEECMGYLWVCSPDIVNNKNGKEWEAILRSTDRSENPIRVITLVAQEGEVSDKWVDGCVNWISGVLKKSGRTGKAEAFACLEILLKRYRSGIPSNLPSSLIPLLNPYLATADISLLSHSFVILSLLLALCPATSYQLIEDSPLKEIYKLSLSPLISGSSLDTLLAFYGSLVQADQDIVKRIVPSLLLEVEKGTKNTTSPGNVARCIAKVVQANMTIAAGVIAEFSKIMRNGKSKELSLVLSLLTLGELGRFISMAHQSRIFESAVGYFISESEDVRSAAAFAAGNMAIGDMNAFLPVITKMVTEDPSHRLLALHALKEVVSHCSTAQLESVADALWDPLFDNSANSEEASRNVAASCLGKLTTTKAPKYLPQLQDRLQDPSPAVRATVISALRYTLADTTRAYDELLAPVIADFLSLMRDQDLTVQRLALSALNSAARNKPRLIAEHLSTLLPQLYEETTMKPSLVEVVQMGPWQHKVDKGLDARKAAYETMYTLLDTCLAKIDLHQFLQCVLVGLRDESDEIKVICHMMLFRMSQVAPAAVSTRLDEAADPLSKTMIEVAVEKNTVKQDLERASELQRSALRAIAALSKIATPGNSPQFDSVVERVKAGQYSAEFKELVAS